MMSLEIKKAAILSVTLVGRLQRADLQARNDLAYQTTGGGTWVEREGTERRGEGQAFQYACMYVCWKKHGPDGKMETFTDSPRTSFLLKIL